ncbi:MAG: Spermidine/putrescine import ATP-binding protein PotA [Frondihabitans sp.]|nr:Spermidine/putrescine import ATP-binding protein PotA [Frondihabitans sp.]
MTGMQVNDSPRPELVTEPRAVAASRSFVQLERLSKSFGGNVVVNDLDLDLAEGEFFSLLGPSGCGKTTTLRMVGGFERPNAGRILIDGHDITVLPPNRRPVNTVFQSYALFTHLTVAENVEFGLRESGVKRGERRSRVADALRLVRLADLGGRRTRELSGGQQQRVALARAIVNRPRLLLLDEPLGALDLKLRKAMQVELKTLQAELGMTFVYVTHDQEEALTMSDRIAVMRDGCIEQIGSPEEIYDRPVSVYVADFIGAANCLGGVVEAVHGAVSTVKLSCGTIVEALSGPGCRPGAPGSVIVRPERSRLCAADEDRGVPGRVKQVMFMGLHRSVVVEADAGATVTAYVASDVDRRFAVGDRVRVDWSTSSGWLLGEVANG